MSHTSDTINNATAMMNQKLKKREIFDPRIIDENDSSKRLWNSDSVELALKGLQEGYKLKDNPFLKSVRGALLRKAHLAYEYSEDEIEILKYCAEDKIFFSNNFVFGPVVIHPLFRVSTTSAISSSVISGGENNTFNFFILL